MIHLFLIVYSSRPRLPRPILIVQFFSQNDSLEEDSVSDFFFSPFICAVAPVTVPSWPAAAVLTEGEAVDPAAAILVTSLTGAVMSLNTARHPLLVHSFVAPHVAYITASIDMRSAVNARLTSNNMPRGPSLQSFLRWPFTMTFSALRWVFSSRSRITRASSLSGHKSRSVRLELDWLVAANSALRRVHRSCSTADIVSIPALRSGAALSEAR